MDMRAWPARPALFVVLLLLALPVACNGAVLPTPAPNPRSPVPGTPSPGPNAALARARQIVDGLNATEPESLDLVEELVALGPEVEPVIRPLVHSDRPVDRWAAYYFLSRHPAAVGSEVFSEGLGDASPTVRALAAGALARRGDQRGNDALVELASDAARPLAFSDPPRTVGDYLRAVSGEPRSGASSRARPGLGFPPMGYAAAESHGYLEFGEESGIPTVTVKVWFYGDGATRADIGAWVREAERVWNPTPANPRIIIRVRPDLGGERPDDHARVLVGRENLPWRLFEFVRSPATGLPPNRGWSGALWSNDNGYAFAHLVGRFLLLDREHRYDAFGELLEASAEEEEAARTGFQLDQTPTGPNPMAQTWPDGSGRPPLARLRQIDHVIELRRSLMIKPAETESPTPSPTATATPTSTATPTPSPTPTPTPTPSPRPTATFTPTAAPTRVLTPTIDPARDLTGTWRGGINLVPINDQEGCVQWSGKLVLEVQHDADGVRGKSTVTFDRVRDIRSGKDCDADPLDPVELTVNGVASVANVTLNLGQDGSTTLTGRFTTDLLSGDAAWGDFVGCWQVARTSLGALPDCNNRHIATPTALPPTPTPTPTPTPRPTAIPLVASVTSLTCTALSSRVVNESANARTVTYVTWRVDAAGTASGPVNARILLEGLLLGPWTLTTGDWSADDGATTGSRGRTPAITRQSNQPANTTWTLTGTYEPSGYYSTDRPFPGEPAERPFEVKLSPRASGTPGTAICKK